MKLLYYSTSRVASICRFSGYLRLLGLLLALLPLAAQASSPSGSNTLPSVSLLAAAPTLTAVAPNPGGLGQSITLTGTNLGSPTALTINGANALGNIISNSGSSLVVRVPVTVAASGNVSITTVDGTATSAFAVMAAPGNALAFDGTNDYVRVPDNSTLDFGAGDFTVEAWVYKGANSSSYKNSTIAGKWNTSVISNSNEWLLQTTSTGSDNFPSLWVETGSDVYRCVGTQPLPLNRWYHLAGVRQGASLLLYVNGVQQGTTAIPPTAALNNVAGRDLLLGAFGTTPAYFTNERLDELRLWKEARTAAQLLAGMTTVLPASTTNLVAYYNFDAGIPGGTNTGLTTLYDLTANANHGTLTSFALTGTDSNWVESYAMVVPTATVATAITATGFTANWTAPALGTVDNGYRVDISTSSTFASVISGSPFTASTGTSLAITGLSANTIYYYRVWADKTSVTSQGAYSNTISVVTCALPTAVAQNVTVSLDAAGNATVTATAVNNGSTANCGPAPAGALSLSGITLPFTCANLGANPVTLTVTDASGNSSTATATVTVVDNAAPVFAACGMGTPASPFTNLNCVKGIATGTYTFSIGGNTFQGYVDGTTDGGGWVEILNYVHKGGTNPALNARTTSLPVQTSATLGADESATTAWGHAAPVLVAAMNPQEVRFYAQTSNHGRIIHFKTSLANVLTYLKTGAGTMTGIGSAGNFTLLPDHTAFLPATTDNYDSNRGAIAATEYPYYRGGANHWGIAGRGYRWEVDDYPNSALFNTIHRIFVRGSATGVPGNAVAADNTTGQCGANVTLTGTQPATDNCTPTITFSPASGSFFAVGATPVTATATDASGNSSISTFVVTVIDKEAPIAVAQAVTVPLAANSTATVAATALNGGSTDNCGPLTYGAQKILSARVSENNNLTLTAPAGMVFTAITFASYGTPIDNGNGTYSLSSCHATNSQAVVAGYLLGQNSATIPATNGIFTDPCGGTIKALVVQAVYGPPLAQLTYTCAEVGTKLALLTVTDASGNKSQSTATVTVTVPPTPTTTWTGGVSTAWTDCQNWSFGKVPDAVTNAIVPVVGNGRYPSLSAGIGSTKDITLASAASLTVASGANLQVNGNWTNNGGTASLPGTVTFIGSMAIQNLGGTAATTFGTLVVNKVNGNVLLGQSAPITTALSMTTGTLTTDANQVSLGTAASISETETSYVIGRVTVTRTVTAGSAQSFSGVGLTLTPAAGSASPGNTLVARTTGTPLTGVGSSQSIQRYFDIQPAVNSGLNITMDFAYFTHELNTIPTVNLRLFKSATALTGPWILQRNTTASTNVVTKTGITDFSIWTLGNSANPLPVELTAFTATAEGDAAVRLAWTTASEKNSDRFEVERSLNGTAFERIGTVAGQGTKAITTNYTLLDGKLPAGAGMLYYRLRQVDADGTFAYSPVRVVTLTPRLPGKLTLAPNPARATTLAGAQPGALVNVYDALGRLVLTATADAAGTAALALPARLATGVYVVRSGTQAVRLVVE